MRQTVKPDDASPTTASALTAPDIMMIVMNGNI